MAVLTKFIKTLFSHNSSQGSITLVALIGVVIIGSIYFVGGVFPKVENIDIGEQGRKVILDDIEAPATGAAEKALRLRTINFKECSERVAVDLLVDNSGSMAGEKLTQLKKALTDFSEKLTDTSVIAVHSFNDKPPQERIGFGLYGQIKTQVANAINTMSAGGGTHTRDAFEFVNTRLTQAQQNFPDQQFALIFFSDGIPEALPRDCTPTRCTATSELRCFQRNQDPTVDPNVAQIIKDKGVTIYSIALLDKKDYCYNDELEGLMRQAATSNQHFFKTYNPEDLSIIYKQITFTLCGESI